MSDSVVSNTIKEHNYFASICFEKVSILKMEAILNLKIYKINSLA